nr:TIGR03086 family metal-binding protein [Haloactinopolyspora alba]
MTEDTAARYRRLAADLTRRVETVPAARWDSPSPCAEWTARGVLGHVIEAHERAPGFVGLPWPPGPSVDDDPVAAWAHTRDRTLEMLEDPSRAELEHDGVFGRTSLAQTVGTFVCFDLIVHGWDIARATGGDETIPPGDVEDAFAFTARLGDMMRTPGVFGPAVPVPDDADRQAQLLGWLGRQP